MKLEPLTNPVGLNESDRALLAQFLERFTLYAVPKDANRNRLPLRDDTDFSSLHQFIVSPDGFLEESAAAEALPVPSRRQTKRPANASTRPEYVFQKAGSHWDVIFAGGSPFHLRDSVGVRYLDYLFHHPNQPIPSFALEITITPEKAAARSPTSIQNHLDPQAARDYRRRLDELCAIRQEASFDGDPATIDHLDREMAALQSHLRKQSWTTGTRERARGNVRKAIAAVRQRLLRGDGPENALEKHISQFIQTGHECIYNQPDGRIWA